MTEPTFVSRERAGLRTNFTSVDPYEALRLSGLARRLKEDSLVAVQVYQAFTNRQWWAADGKVWWASFRQAAGMVAYLREDGTNYVYWYGSARAGVLTDDIKEAMAAIGWRSCSVRSLDQDDLAWSAQDNVDVPTNAQSGADSVWRDPDRRGDLLRAFGHSG